MLAWFEGQPPSEEATRTYASVATQFCKSKRPDCSAGVEEIKQKNKSPLEFTNPRGLLCAQGPCAS